MKKILFFMISCLLIFILGCSENNSVSTIKPDPDTTPVGSTNDAPTKKENTKQFNKDTVLKISPNGEKIAYLDNENLYVYDINTEEEVEISPKVSHFQWYDDNLYFISQTAMARDLETNQLQKTDGKNKEVLVDTMVDENTNSFNTPLFFDINDEGKVLLTVRSGVFLSEYWDEVFLTDISFENPFEVYAEGTVFNNPTWSGNNNKSYFVVGMDTYEYYRDIMGLLRDGIFTTIESKLLKPFDEVEFEDFNKIEVTDDLLIAYIRQPSYNNESNIPTYYVSKVNLEDGARTRIENAIDFKVYNDFVVLTKEQDEKKWIEILKNEENVFHAEVSEPVIYKDKLYYLDKDYKTIKNIEFNNL